MTGWTAEQRAHASTMFGYEVCGEEHEPDKVCIRPAGHQQIPLDLVSLEEQAVLRWQRDPEFHARASLAQALIQQGLGSSTPEASTLRYVVTLTLVVAEQPFTA